MTAPNLIQRLRAYVESEDYISAEPLCAEAADELERLRAQVASLSREAWTWSKALESQLAAPAQQAVVCDNCGEARPGCGGEFKSDGTACKFHGTSAPSLTVGERAEPVGWQGRKYYPDPDDEGWGDWHEVHNSDLEFYRRASKDSPKFYELRPIYTQPAAQGAGELPPLPEPEGTVEVDCGPAPGGGREVMYSDGYSADQMHAYARAALAQAPAAEPLTHESIRARVDEMRPTHAMASAAHFWFINGVRWAERAHGIGAAKEQP